MYTYHDQVLLPRRTAAYEDCALYTYEGADVPDILFLQGGPYHRGYAQGVLLADRIAHLCAHMLTLLCSMAAGYTGQDKTPPRAEQVAAGKAKMLAIIERNLAPAIKRECPEHFEELRGLCDGVQTKYPDIPYEDLLIINTTPEGVEETRGCSNVIAFGRATRDGGALHGINMDYQSFGAFHKGIVTAVVKPDRGNAYIGAVYAGGLFPMSFVNEKGISYGEMTSSSTRRSWPQITHYVQAKLFAQGAGTLEEALDIAGRTGGTSGFINFLCREQGSAEALSIETAGDLSAARGPGSDRLGKEDLLFTTNFFNVFKDPAEPDSLIGGQIDYLAEHDGRFAGKKTLLLGAQNLSRWVDLMDCPRYAAFERLLPDLYGSIDVPALIRLMSAYPISRGGDNLPPEYVFCPSSPMPYGLDPMPLSTRHLVSIYSLIAEPGKGRIHIAAGLEPAQAGRFLTVSLDQGLRSLEALARG
jgi:hypothetical protein